MTLPNHSIHYRLISHTDLQKVDVSKTFDEISTITNIPFVEVNEIGNKVGTKRLFINSLISSCSEESIGDALGDIPSQNPSNGDIFFTDVLDRDYDQADYNFWVVNLRNGLG